MEKNSPIIDTALKASLFYGIVVFNQEIYRRKQMDNLTIIKKRLSRRSYLGTDLSTKQVSALESHIEHWNEISGLTSFFLANGSSAFSKISKSYGMFKGVKSLIVLKGLKSDKDLKEKVGYYGELLILEATKMNLGTCWVGGTFDKESNIFQVEADEELICVITVGNVLMEESFKERILRKTIRRNTKEVGELCEAIGEMPDWLASGMEGVQLAPSTKNTQKVLFLYKTGVLRASIPDTYKFDYVDLGIAKLHFELCAGGHFELGNGGRYFRG